MTPTPHPLHRRAGLLLLALSMPLSSLRAEEPNPAQNSPREILRDALYAEEVTRDATKAAESYSKVLELYKAQQPFAATALFRLAEVRRKQGNKEEAAKLYQQLLREFPNAEVEGKLARENLAAMGAAPADAAEAPVLNDAESKELLRLQELMRTSPDLAKDPKAIEAAASKGQLRVMALLIDSGIDPKSGDALIGAVASGNLKAVELLLAKGCNPAVAPHDKAIRRAVEDGYHTIAALLLKSGANANYQFQVEDGDSGYAPTNNSLLHQAASKRDERMCRLLLDHGADPNFMPPLCFPRGDSSLMPVGTPLHQAIASDSGKGGSLALMLLKAGAKPDLAASGSGLTPLHLAASKGSVPVIQALLDAGVAVDPRSKMPEAPGPPSRGGSSPWHGHQAGTTPLDYALYAGSEDAVRLLLSKGVDPNAVTASGSTTFAHALSSSKPSPLVKLLVEAGAKVTSPDDLVNAASNPSLEVIELLLGAGANINAVSPYFKKTALESAVNNGRSPQTVRLLIDRGAKLEESALKRSLENTNDNDEIRGILFDRFVLPGLLSKPAVTLVFSRVPAFQRTLATREGDPGPASLEALLLRVDSLPFIQTPGTSQFDPEVYPRLITIHRRDAGGAVRKIAARIDGTAALPKLEWGDVVNLDLDPASFEKGIPKSFNFAYHRIKSPELFWSLRKQLATPVIVLIEGKAREMTLRGDCLVYHPGEAVAPLLPANRLAEVLWSQFTPDYLRVRRAGWPEIRIDKGHAEWLQFEFQAGDEIKPGYKEDPAVAESKTRRATICLKVPGSGFGRTYWLIDPQDLQLLDRVGFGVRSVAINPQTLPTLVELITDTYASMPHHLAKDLAGSAESRWGEMAARQLGFSMTRSSSSWESFRTLIVPQDPDLSKIRILRMGADDKETVQEVDLTKAIAATTDATTAEEARRGDVKLQAGDVVEIALKPRGEGKAWTGFNQAEVRFFSKVLGGSYQFSDSDGLLSRRNLVWQPVKWLESPAGPVPFPPDSGVASTSTCFQDEMANSAGIKLGRGEEEERGADRGFFIRDGDRIRVTDPNVPRSTPPSVRPPRPRVEPGPSR